MLTKRIIPCLDVKNGRVVKGTQFKMLQDAGDPVRLARNYYKQGADELVVLDIAATLESRRTVLKLIDKISRQIFIPLTVGGGIRTLRDIELTLRAGADKVAINTAAVKNPKLIEQAAEKFGSQCIVIAIDAKRTDTPDNWQVMIKAGTKSTGLDVLDWAGRTADLGAGEILLTSMDCDGTQRGYDLKLLRTISQSVSIPAIASGGAGSKDDVYQAFAQGNADAALLASLFHYKTLTISGLKNYLSKNKINIRLSKHET